MRKNNQKDSAPKAPFPASASKLSKNPAIEALMKTKRAISQTDTVSVLANWEKFENEPSTKARQGLDQLFHRASGLPLGNVYYPARAYEPIKGGDPAALQEYARLICEHVENLNSLISRHRRNLLPISKTRFTWPVLKSKHPFYSEDHKAILNVLDVGSAATRHLATYCRYKSGGKIAMFVDELLWWADACHHKCPVVVRNIYVCEDEDCPHPLISRLRRHLEPRELEVARMKQLDGSNVSEWERFMRVLLTDCFKDSRCAAFLSLIFVTAESRKQKCGGHGKAKQYLIRKICDRLKSLVGDKAEAK